MQTPRDEVWEYLDHDPRQLSAKCIICDDDCLIWAMCCVSMDCQKAYMPPVPYDALLDFRSSSYFCSLYRDYVWQF